MKKGEKKPLLSNRQVGRTAEALNQTSEEEGSKKLYDFGRNRKNKRTSPFTRGERA